MKRMTILFLIAFAPSIFSQIVGPKLSITEKEFDFGVIIQGERVTHNFQVYNTGDDLLKISKVRASCGCTAAMPDKRELAPGESTIIKVEFNSAKRLGRQKKYVYVSTNDPKSPEVRLVFYATIKQDENAQNTKLGPRLTIQKTQHNFGVVTQGEVLDLNLRLKNAGDKTLKIESVKSSCGCTAALLSSKILEPKEGGNLKIELDTSGRTGKLTRTVTIISNDFRMPTQTISLFVTVKKKS